MKISKSVCQSCSAPILKDFDKGMERNGGFSKLYCRRCYRFGEFIDAGMTANRMHEDVRAKMLGMKFPRHLALLLADQVYHLKRWETPQA
jgi:hypothetical protein